MPSGDSGVVRMKAYIRAFVGYIGQSGTDADKITEYLKY